MAKDRIFRSLKRPLPPFEFNAEVVAAFDDMIHRSLPYTPKSFDDRPSGLSDAGSPERPCTIWDAPPEKMPRRMPFSADERPGDKTSLMFSG